MELPPLHPILVNFTAGLVPASFALDLLGAWLKKDALRAAGWWTLLLAACLTPLTALAGWLWKRSMGDMDHWQMPIHMWLGISLAVLFILMAIWRGWLYYHSHSPGWAYASVAAVLLGALMFQGDLGGSMSFGRGIFISAGNEGGHSHGGDETDHHGGERSDTHSPSTEAGTQSVTQPAGGHEHSGHEHSASDAH